MEWWGIQSSRTWNTGIGDFNIAFHFRIKTSKSVGKTIFGRSKSSIFPAPCTVSFIVIGSLAFTSVLSICDFMVNVPTAPLKLSGLSLVGVGFTLIVNPLETIFFLTSLYRLLKNGSLKKNYQKKESEDLRLEAVCTLTVRSVSFGIISISPALCGKRANLRTSATLYCLFYKPPFCRDITLICQKVFYPKSGKRREFLKSVMAGNLIVEIKLVGYNNLFTNVRGYVAYFSFQEYINVSRWLLLLPALLWALAGWRGLVCLHLPIL